MLKQCTKCKDYKDGCCFYKRNDVKDKLSSHCISCCTKHRIANKKKISKRMATYRKQNKSLIRQSSREYYQANKETIKAKRKKYNALHKDKLREYWKKYSRSRKRKQYEHSLNRRLSVNLRNRLNMSIKNNARSGSAVRDLGCSIPEFKKYLESKFQRGMSWANWTMDGWHIDHIKPLASFDLSDRNQLLVACHYTNLQPLWANDNYVKHATI